MECLRFGTKQATQCVCVYVCVLMKIMGDNEVGGVYIKQGHMHIYKHIYI